MITKPKKKEKKRKECPELLPLRACARTKKLRSVTLPPKTPMDGLDRCVEASETQKRKKQTNSNIL